MKTSEVGRSLIKRWEGSVDRVYVDIAGHPTGGVGHLLDPAEQQMHAVGSYLSPSQIDTWLADDLAEAEAAVWRHIKVPLSQYEFDALVSLVFNVGPKPLYQTLGTKLNAGDRDGAAEQFKWWRMAGGQTVLGLQLRRAAEEQLFRTPDNMFVPRPWEEWGWPDDAG